jgi:hypothetical protein
LGNEWDLPTSFSTSIAASLLDRETTFWLLERHAIGTPFKKIIKHPTDFLPLGSPAQSKSE